MRIAQIIMSASAGGAEILARDLAVSYAQTGHHCLIVTLADAGEIGNDVPYQAAYIAYLTGRSVPVRILGSGNFVARARELRRLVKDFDIVHAHTPRGLLLLPLSGRPVIYTHHNVRLNFPAWLFAIFNRMVDTYVAVSAPCAALLEKHVSRPLVRIPNGSAFPSGSPRTSLPPNPTVLSLGFISPQKDYENLVRAAAIVVPHMAARGRSIRFRIAGAGDQTELRRCIEAAGLEDRVELLGARSDVRELIDGSDLLVNSSIFEGLPVSLIEAARAGLPIVATAVGGTPEITANLVSPSDPLALAGKIIATLDDEGAYRAVSAAGIEAGAAFSIEACAQAHLRLYESLSAAGRKRPPIHAGAAGAAF